MDGLEERRAALQRELLEIEQRIEARSAAPIQLYVPLPYIRPHKRLQCPAFYEHDQAKANVGRSERVVKFVEGRVAAALLDAVNAGRLMRMTAPIVAAQHAKEFDRLAEVALDLVNAGNDNGIV